MKKSFFLSVIIFAVLLFMTEWISVGIRDVVIYIDFMSMLLVLLCPLVLLLANFSLSDIRKYFAIGFKEENVDPIDLENGIVFFSSLQKYLILSGMMGAFVGIMAVLANLAEPEVIGGGLALSLMTVLYSIILTMGIAVPFKTGLQKRLNEIPK